MSNLIIVAHPDDETLFAYSVLQKGNCHVLCMTGRNRPTFQEFQKVASRLSFTYDIFENDDSWNGTFDATAIEQVKSVLWRGYDAVFTHNNHGEYGHTQHKALHDIVFPLVTKNLHVFGFGNIPLSFQSLKDKLEVLSLYEIHGGLRVWDWYDEANTQERMMNYVVSEGFLQVK